MKLSSIQSRKYILGILKKLHAFIDSESFDPETDLEIVRSKKKEPPYLFVFGDEINNRQIYIKLKIKEKTHKHILCVSFHYAKWKMRFPFKHN